MPGDAVQIGPFVKGLNTYSDPSSISDNELAQAENWDLDLDGSLKSRPPIVDRGITFPLGSTGNVLYLGYVRLSGADYLLASNGLSSTYYFNGTTWTLITSTFAATAMVQFDSKAYMTAPVGSANPGGYWSPGTGFVADANMPKGDTIVAHKFRMWIAAGKDATVNNTRMYRSEVQGSSPIWPVSPAFVDIGAGDGQAIVTLVVYFNKILVFRTGSIYSYQYAADPAKFVVSLVVPGVGLVDKNAVSFYENFVYFIFDDRAYEYINDRVNQINVQVPFDADSRTSIFMPYAVSTFNQRVIFSYFDTMFVYSLSTRTWTTWRSTAQGSIGKIIERPVSVSIYPEAITHSSAAVPTGGTRTAKMLFITDGYTSETEQFTATAQTKIYNYQSSSSYKRLFWWGLDATYRSTVTAVAIPISYNYTITWAKAAMSTWGTVKSFTWGQPLSGGLEITTGRTASGTGPTRKFTKFLKSLRFRQVYYRLTFDNDGSVTTAPVRLFSLTTFISLKERVSKALT